VAPNFVFKRRAGPRDWISKNTVSHGNEIRRRPQKSLPAIPPWEIAVTFISETKVETDSTARAVVLCRTLEIPISYLQTANLRYQVSMLLFVQAGVSSFDIRLTSPYDREWAKIGGWRQEQEDQGNGPHTFTFRHSTTFCWCREGFCRGRPLNSGKRRGATSTDRTEKHSSPDQP
jgi:hypothetical protein